MDERLKKFVQLVDAGSYTKAAGELHVSQPALSVAIAKLERELRAPLLVHGVRPLALTPAGQLAYNTGKDMLLKTSNLRTLLAELEQREVAVSVGMIDSVAGMLFASPQSVDELERNTSVSLVVDNSRNLLQAVERGQLDVAFVVGRQNYSAALEVVNRASEPLVVVCHVAQRARFNRAARSGRLPHFISYNQASNTYQLVVEALQERRVMLDTTFYSTSPEVILRLVLLQRGVAALPYLLVREHLDAGALTLVGQPRPYTVHRPIHAVKRRDTVLAAPLVHTAWRVGVLLDVIETQADALLGVPTKSRGR